MSILKNIKNLVQIAIEFSQQMLITYVIFLISGFIFPVTYNKQEIDLVKLLMHTFLFQILLPIITFAFATITTLFRIRTGALPQNVLSSFENSFNSLRGKFTRNIALELLKMFILGALKRIFIGATAGTIMFVGYIMVATPILLIWPQAFASEEEKNNMTHGLSAMPKSYGILHGPILEEVVFRVFWMNVYKAMYNIGMACVKGLYNIMPNIRTPNRMNDAPDGGQNMPQKIMTYENRVISLISNAEQAVLFSNVHFKPQIPSAFVKGMIIGELTEQYGIDIAITAHVTNNLLTDIVSNVFQSSALPRPGL